MKRKATKTTKKMTRTKPYHYKGCGLDNVYLHGGVTYVDTPRGKAVQIENIEGLHRAIGH